ncbi:Glutathione S-transferase GST-4.5 [Pseudoalteromonas holothuriae]|uniref:Glutathione S-transferase GST-4.5 n=1 Tax=Pseudoalteromonas holothuriae TaxID=2963714 RepID=A0ABN8ULP1_9GAMM|nr:glutathione S-transferase family protein [Pseudoalteromonas sp. CIP111951]CAH9060027.1 Glutathione S-transferase GST-4.5 [Pseudoalteromonas sp. CIP111951]
MYTLYHFPISCSNVVKIVLELIDVEHQVCIVDLLNAEQRSPEFLALNPSGKVPVLVEGDRVMTQSAAILIHLSQKFPDANLMPDLASEEGMEALKWFDFISASLHGNFDKVIHSERISNDSDIVKANAEELILKQLELVESRLLKSTFLTGEQPSLADYYFAVILGWSKMLSFNLLERYPIFADFKVKLKVASPQSNSLQAL